MRCGEVVAQSWAGRLHRRLHRRLQCRGQPSGHRDSDSPQPGSWTTDLSVLIVDEGGAELAEADAGQAQRRPGPGRARQGGRPLVRLFLVRRQQRRLLISHIVPRPPWMASRGPDLWGASSIAVRKLYTCGMSSWTRHMRRIGKSSCSSANNYMVCCRAKAHLGWRRNLARAAAHVARQRAKLLRLAPLFAALQPWGAVLYIERLGDGVRARPQGVGWTVMQAQRPLTKLSPSQLRQM